MVKYHNMQKKIKFIQIFAVVIIFLSLSLPAFALELTYPTLPGIGTLGTKPTLPQFIGYFFVFILAIVGIIGVLAIAISGVKILLSAGNPTAISDARERILSAVLGIILLLFSIVLLRTINPSLVNPRTSVLPITSGLYFVKDVSCGTNTSCQDNYPDGKDYRPGPTNMANSAETIPAGFTKLSYKCTAGPNLLVWAYDNPDYVVNNFEANGQPNLTTYSMPCSQTEVLCDGSNNTSCNTLDLASNNILSYKTDIEKPGIYFYLNPDCSGLSSPVMQSSGDIPNFASNFQGGEPPVLGVRIVNTDLMNRYGTVLTQHFQFEGECSPPIIKSDQGSQCFNIPNDSNGNVFNPFSAHIIKQAQWSPENGEVKLYSANLGLTLFLAEIDKHYTVTPGPPGSINYNETPSDFFKNEGYKWRSANKVPDDPTNLTTAPPECKDADGNYICLNYIETVGAFNIFLYGESPDIEDNLYKSCILLPNGLIADYWPDANETFKNFLSEGNSLYRMDIIPRPY